MNQFKNSGKKRRDSKVAKNSVESNSRSNFRSHEEVQQLGRIRRERKQAEGNFVKTVNDKQLTKFEQFDS